MLRTDKSRNIRQQMPPSKNLNLFLTPCVFMKRLLATEFLGKLHDIVNFETDWNGVTGLV